MSFRTSTRSSSTNPAAFGLAGVGVVAAFVAIILLSSLWGAFVLSTLWNWFVATTLHAPVLTLPQAYGLSLTAAYFTCGLANGKTGSYIATSVFLLVFGFIAHALFF